MKIILENVSFGYESLLAEKRDVLKNINLTIAENEIVGILGQSGSGKTTLIQHFNGLLKPTRGKIFLDDKNFWTKSISMTDIRRLVGLVFQFPENQFFEETVFAEIAFGLQNLGISPPEIQKLVKSALEMVKMDYAKIHSQNPHFLSAGEKRRVALASIIAMRPQLLVLDEPTAGLDLSGIRMLKHLIQQYLDGERSIVVVSHNMELLFELVHRLIILHEGQVVFDGKIPDLVTQNINLTEWGLQLPRHFRFLPLIKKFNNQSTLPLSRKELVEFLTQ